MSAEALAAMRGQAQIFSDIATGRRNRRDDPAAIEKSESMGRVFAAGAEALAGGSPDNAGHFAVLHRAAAAAATAAVDLEPYGNEIRRRHLAYLASHHTAAADALELAELLS